MGTANQNCVNCGAALTREQKKHRYKYCSRDCYYTARYGEEAAWGNISVRGAVRIEALDLCHNGMTQKGAAKALGLHHSVVARLFKRHGADTIAPDQRCVFCGKSLLGIGFQANRKYCSKECSYQMSYSRKYPDRERVPVDYEARRQALDLYWGGLDSGTISRYLSVLPKTVRSWIHRYGSANKREICSQALKLGALRYWLRAAGTAAEWRGILETAADESGECKAGVIRLMPVCVNGRAEWSYYAAIVTDLLKMDPFSGEIFAFCNHLRNTITAITWQNGTFLLTRAHKESGTYLWPAENMGMSLPVSDGAFRHLLNYQKYLPGQAKNG